MSKQKEIPAEVVKEKLNELKDIETKITKSIKRREELNNEICSLQKKIDEIKPIVNNYSQMYSIIEKETKNIENFSEINVLENNIKDKIDVINKKIANVDNPIKEKEEYIDGLDKEYKNASDQLEEARKKCKGKQKSYDTLKSFQNDTINRLKELKNLKELIERYTKVNETAKVHFLKLELRNLLENTSIKTPEKFESELFEKWNDLDSAKTEVKNKEEAMKKISNNLENERNKFNLLKKDRIGDILKII